MVLKPNLLMDKFTTRLEPPDTCFNAYLYRLLMPPQLVGWKPFASHGPPPDKYTRQATSTKPYHSEPWGSV
jgi:hypothetical protein